MIADSGLVNRAGGRQSLLLWTTKNQTMAPAGPGNREASKSAFYGGCELYKPGGTLRDALTHIEQKRSVLPAIQREFVWKPNQICELFDSLMQGFPFGTFLF